MAVPGLEIRERRRQVRANPTRDGTLLQCNTYVHDRAHIDSSTLRIHHEVCCSDAQLKKERPK